MRRAGAARSAPTHEPRYTLFLITDPYSCPLSSVARDIMRVYQAGIPLDAVTEVCDHDIPDHVPMTPSMAITQGDRSTFVGGTRFFDFIKDMHAHHRHHRTTLEGEGAPATMPSGGLSEFPKNLGVTLEEDSFMRPGVSSESWNQRRAVGEAEPSAPVAHDRDPAHGDEDVGVAFHRAVEDGDAAGFSDGGRISSSQLESECQQRLATRGGV